MRTLKREKYDMPTVTSEFVLQMIHIIEQHLNNERDNRQLVANEHKSCITLEPTDLCPLQGENLASDVYRHAWLHS